ncbi:MAG: helix-turn-helix domain-containing protein [Patescibacteria group bacterium]
MKEIIGKLHELEFSPNEVRVYVALTELGEALASKIAKKANLPRTTVISILNNFAERGFVSAHRYRGASYYWVESPKTVRDIFANKVLIAEQLDSLLGGLYRSEAHFPSAEVYDSRKSVKNFIEKTLVGLKKNSVIRTIDAPQMGNYSKVLSDEYQRVLIGLKRKRGVATRTLVPYGTLRAISPRKMREQDIQVRELPERLAFTASLWLINDMAVLFSGKPPFAVAVRHDLIVESLSNLFEHFWRTAARAQAPRSGSREGA